MIVRQVKIFSADAPWGKAEHKELNEFLASKHSVISDVTWLQSSAGAGASGLVATIATVLTCVIDLRVRVGD